MVRSGNILKANIFVIKQDTEVYGLKAYLLKTSKKKIPFAYLTLKNWMGKYLTKATPLKKHTWYALRTIGVYTNLSLALIILFSLLITESISRCTL